MCLLACISCGPQAAQCRPHALFSLPGGSCRTAPSLILCWYPACLLPPVQDAGLSQPSEWEQQAQRDGSSSGSSSGSGSGSTASQYAADRHTKLPFAALAEMLQRIAAATGSAERYQRQVAAGAHHVALLPDGKLQPA